MNTNMKMINSTRWKVRIGRRQLLIIVLIGLPVLVFSVTYARRNLSAPALTSQQESHLQTFSVADLGQFDGTDSAKPIYIGLNGYVYDVSAGREFYQAGGTYHFLAGKDSSAELNLIGGDIIAKKYPIVGKLVD